MGIYTKTGDKGTTSLFDDVRVKKYAPRVDTYGTFDECIAQLSVAEKQATSKQIKDILIWIQKKLFLLNAEVATSADEKKLADKSTLIQEEDIHQLEHWIDDLLKDLPEIHQFILPGSSLAGAQLHVARTVCRRGERRLIELSETESIRSEILQFVNRLSDCIYALARAEDDYEQKEMLINKILQRYRKEVNRQMAESMDKLKCLQKVLTACVKKAEEISVPMCIALVDKEGHLIGSFRMPETLLVSTEIAHKKAYTAVALKQPSGNLGAAIQPGAELYNIETSVCGDIVTFGGGFPLYDKDGTLTAGIGVSGGSVAEDEIVAEAGIKCFKELK